MEPYDPRFVSRAEVFAERPHRAAGIRFEGLWVAGSLAGLARRTVAVVGTRAPSEAGRERARHMCGRLAKAGVCVISGLALGIDAAAHEGALDGGAPTLGILGGGHAHFFPRRNRDLAARIVANGGAVLSPFAPHEPARPPQFLQRNGVVAALADAVVVVEAAERSGALNTAGWAAALGIDVLAFPGDVDRPKAAGTNALIRDGATLVRHAEDVLDALGIAAPPRNAADACPRDARDAALLRCLAAEPLTLEGIVTRTGYAVSEALARLVTLELEGAIERRSDTLEYALA
jgi:DNA processing protein